MLRSVPGALDPGSPPEFRSPDDVVAWVRAVDWLVGADRAVVLHLDGDGRLTCVATGHSRLQHLGPLAKDAMAAEAHHCGAVTLLAVDVREKLPSKGVNATDRRRHRHLRVHLAINGVALIDTVIVASEGGLSVSGSLCYPLGGGLSWLRVHVPPHRVLSDAEGWTHEQASAYPPGSARILDVDHRPTLWLAGRGDEEEEQ